MLSQNSKALKTSFRALTASILASATLAACTPPSTQKSDSTGGATFVVDKVSASFSSTENNSTFSLPIAKTLSVTACMSDIQYSRTIKNHDFVIQGGDQDQEMKTDGDGCLNWQERIPFNSLADAAYLQADRTLLAKGFQKGARKISLALNPWSGDALYLKEKGVANLVGTEQMKLRLAATNTSKPIWINSIKADVVQGSLSSATTYNVHLQAAPTVLLKSATGEISALPLTQGQFQARASLIRVSQIGGQEKRDLIGQSDLTPTLGLIQGLLIFDVSFPVAGDCSLATYEIGLDVTPVGGPAGLQESHGIYPMGACESFLGNHAPNLKNTPDFTQDKIASFDLKKYVTGTALSKNADGTTVTNHGTAAASIQEGVLSSPIQVSQLRADHLKFESISDSVKRHYYWLYVCLVNGLDRRPIVEHPVTVTGANGKVFPAASTDASGCMRVEDYVEFNYFAPKCLIPKSINVKNPDLGLNETIPVLINAENDAYLGLIDTRHAPKESYQDQVSNCTSGKSTQIASGYSFDKMSMDYSIDENLNLKITKTGVLNLTVRVNRKSVDSSTGVEPVLLPAGNYILRWAVVDNEMKDYTKPSGGMIYGIGEQKVMINGGSMVQTLLNISMTNIKAVGNTNSVLFELSPVDPQASAANSNLEITTFRAPILLSHDGSADNIFPVPGISNVIPGLKAVFDKDQQNSFAYSKRIGQKDAWAKANNLTLINVNHDFSSPFPHVTSLELRNWVRTGTMTTEQMENLCGDWAETVLAAPAGATRTTPYRRYHTLLFDSVAKVKNECVKRVKQDPRRFFDLEAHYFTVGAHRDTSVEVAAVEQDLTLSQSFQLSRAYGDTQSTTWSHDVSAGITLKTSDLPIIGEIPVLNMLSASGGIRYNVAHTKGVTTTMGNSLYVQNGKTMTVETLPIRILADDYEKCMVVRMDANIALTDDMKDIFRDDLSVGERLNVANRGYLVCWGANSHQSLKFDENYYVINQRIPETSAMNNSADASRPFFVQLRSRRDFAAFISYVQGSYQVPDQFTGDYEQTHMMADSAEAVFLRGLGSAPGQIIEAQ